MRGNWLRKVLKVLLLVIIAGTVLSFLVMALWNRLMPFLFGLHAISYWQALGILILSRILFGGFRGRPGGGGRWRGRMMDRWARMTPEEQEKFRAGMRNRCGGVVPPAADVKA